MGMIPWGKVVDAWKETAALWGKINGSWQVLEENFGAPYNEALALVGIDKVDSLSVVLTNSEYCTALAGNAEAVEIMKANYSTDMTSTIDSNWNEGLNLLNYRCKLPCYLFYNGNDCSAITGGFTYQDRFAYLSGNALYNTSAEGTDWSGRSIWTANKLSFDGYSTLGTYFSYTTDRGQWCRYGIASSNEASTEHFVAHDELKDQISNTWKNVNISSYNDSYYYKLCVYVFTVGVTYVKIS